MTGIVVPFTGTPFVMATLQMKGGTVVVVTVPWGDVKAGSIGESGTIHYDGSDIEAYIIDLKPIYEGAR